ARGVEIRSRYCKAYELETMLVAVCTLSERMVRHVRSIFDNSKIGYAYTIGIAPWDVSVAQAIAEHVEQTAIKCNEGHNGILVTPEGGSVADEDRFERDPCWPGIQFLSA